MPIPTSISSRAISRSASRKSCSFRWRSCCTGPSTRASRRARRCVLARADLDRRLVVPVALPGALDHRGIFGASEAAVVTAERAEQVAFLQVEIVAQDHAAVAQVGAQVKQ